MNTKRLEKAKEIYQSYQNGNRKQAHEYAARSTKNLLTLLSAISHSGGGTNDKRMFLDGLSIYMNI